MRGNGICNLDYIHLNTVLTGLVKHISYLLMTYYNKHLIFKMNTVLIYFWSGASVFKSFVLKKKIYSCKLFCYFIFFLFVY